MPAEAAQDRPWLPPGKRAAVVFSIDDVHPGRSTDPYEAGGDLGEGALGHLEWLLARHPALQATLFVTADWREISPFPTRRLLARVPWLRERRYLAPIHPKGRMRLDRHPEFVRYLQGLPRVEVALHGLHHVHVGPRLTVEFQEQPREECARMLRAAQAIFREAGLPAPRGMTPPAWNAPPALLEAMAEVGLRYVASARDIRTPIGPAALAAMSGLQGQPLAAPGRVAGGALVHLPSNFQATSSPERAHQVVAQGGLLSVKAHVVKQAFGHVALDGLDALYRNYLDTLFTQLEDRYGDGLWWASMAEVAERTLAAATLSRTGTEER